MINYYLEYNSTINCSLIFSGIISLVGTPTTFPSILDGFQSNQSKLFVLADKELEIASKDLDFSRTPTTSPTLRDKKGYSPLHHLQ